jgi:hypothetical protein
MAAFIAPCRCQALVLKAQRLRFASRGRCWPSCSGVGQQQPLVGDHFDQHRDQGTCFEEHLEGRGTLLLVAD